MSIFKRLLLSILLITISSGTALGTVFTATQSGNWSAAATWGGTTPGLTVDTIHDIVIPAGITVTLDNDVKIKGLLTINGGTLTIGNHELTIVGDYVTTLGGSLDVTANSELSLRGDAKSAPIQFTQSSDTLANLYVNTGYGNALTIESVFHSDLHIMDTLYLKKGHLNFHDQTIGMYGDILLGDSTKIEGNEATDILLKTSGNIVEAPNTFQGEFYFNKADTFWVEMTGQDSVVMGYISRVYGDLILNQGRVILANGQFVMEEGSEIHGGSSTSYVQTNGTHDLRVKTTAGDSIFYPIGTASGYKPASLKLNASTPDGNYGVPVIDQVYEDSLSGNLLSDSSDVVNQTWEARTYGISGNVDVNFAAYWSAQQEMNQFNRDSCFISHYNNGWDQGTYMKASTTASGMFTISRDSLTSLSPFAVFSESTAQIFIAQSSGKWSNSSNWSGGTAPGGSITGGAQVIIPSGISIELDQDIQIAGSSSALEVSGDLFNANQTVTAAEGTITGTGSMDIHTLNIQSSAVLAFTGDLTVNNLYSQNTLIELAAMATVEDTIACHNASLQINAGSQLTLQDDVTFIIENSSISNHSISIAGNGGVNLVFMGDEKVTTGEISLGTINDVTVDFDNPDDRLILSQNLIVQGVLNVNNGIVDLNDNGMSLRSDLQMSATGYLMATDNSSMSLKTNASLSSAVKFTGGSDTLNGLTIEVGSGNEAEFDSDVAVGGKFNLRSGTMNIKDQDLHIYGSATAEAEGQLATNESANLRLQANGGIDGMVYFDTTANMMNDLIIDFSASSDTVALASEVAVNGELNLNNGNVILYEHNLTITANGTMAGGSKSSYVQTEGNGMLSIYITAGNDADYPIGTDQGFAPANVELNSNSDDADYMVNVKNDVKANGHLGTDISASESVVDHTWDLRSNATSTADVNLSLTWEGSAEVNGFDNQNCYISHFSSSSWDANATASATANANGTFTITRNNITSFSPFAVFDENTSVGIEDKFTAKDYINMYPNPAKNTLYITSDLDGSTMIQIYSVDGKLIKQAKLHPGNNQLDISNMQEGTYYLQLTEADAGIPFIKQ